MAGATTLVLVGAAVYGVYQQEEARKDSRRAARAQERAQKVQTAQQEATDIAARRQQIRQERVRRAQILQASQQLGVADGSGQIGSIGSLQTSVASQGAATRAQQNTANAVSMFNTEANRALLRSQEHQALAGLSFQVAGFAASKSGGK